MRRNRLYTLAAVPLALVLLPFIAFVVNRVASSGEIIRNVHVADVDLGGLGEADARMALGAFERRLTSQAVIFQVEDDEFALEPVRVDLEIDEDTLISEAMAVRRGGGLLAEFRSWIGSFGNVTEIEPMFTMNEEEIVEVLGEWEQAAIDNPAYTGGVVVSGTLATADYPRQGEAIDVPEATRMVANALTTVDSLPVRLPVVTAIPTVTAGQIDAAVQEANLLLDEPVTLSRAYPEIAITFTREDLGNMLSVEVDDAANPPVRLWFDPDLLATLLDPIREIANQPAVDATFVVHDDDTVTIVPSHHATALDVELVASALYEEALRGDAAELPLANVGEPEFTTQDAAEVGPITKVSEFTTNHPAGQARVTNIHTIADAVDGVVVAPGEVFSLNDHVGPRTRDKGYVEAPMILRGEIVDDVGGGVSQFATTFYNAVFFGCYEDVAHRPHSRYFSRYPEGREATISWPEPDLEFRNDTETPLIIRTAYTSSSITVKFFGNTEGRTCDAKLSDRYSYTSAPIEYVGDASVAPGGQRTTQSGAQGWSVTITRVVTHADGRVEEQKWTHAYQPIPTKIVLHPCDIPEGAAGYTGENCPRKVPPLGGLTAAQAEAAITAAGFTMAIGPPLDVSIESGLDGLVADHDPRGGSYRPAGSTVTIRLGIAPEPPPPEPGDGAGDGAGDGGGGEGGTGG